MTLAFDKKAIRGETNQTKLSNLFQPNPDTKPKELKIKKVPAKQIRGYVATYHYTHIMPDNAMECYAGYYGNKLAGNGWDVNLVSKIFKRMFPEAKTIWQSQQ